MALFNFARKSSLLEPLLTLFAGRTLLIATQHGKEKVLAPLLAPALGVKVTINERLDTDSLGSFSGEVAREKSALETAREKCRLAMQLHQCDLALASEGSFGPHPEMPLLAEDEEYLVLTDALNNLEIRACERSLETNYASATVERWEDLRIFALNAGFPEHALILRPSAETAATTVLKGINQWDNLEEAFQNLSGRFGRLLVQTDMRAMFNPTRMRVIERAAHKLLLSIRSLCPQCGMPGFDVTEVKPGLPCDWCRWPTRLVLEQTLTCTSCGHRQAQLHPAGNSTADPMYCDRCNP